MGSLTKYRFKDLINPLKWWSVLMSYKYKEVLPAPHIIIQYAMRFTSPGCQPCMKAGECKMPCKCKIPDKMLVPWETDSDGNWGPIIEDEQEFWAWMNEYNITFEPKYNEHK
jgi:hypothetical protein